jgi:hypothetical protein
MHEAEADSLNGMVPMQMYRGCERVPLSVMREGWFKIVIVYESLGVEPQKYAVWHII